MHGQNLKGRVVHRVLRAARALFWVFWLEGASRRWPQVKSWELFFFEACQGSFDSCVTDKLQGLQ